MMKPIKKLLFVLINLLVITTQAQKSNVAAGGNASGASGTASYSIGQISYKSPAGTIVSDGVQQPYEIQVLGTSDYPNITLEMLVYPNPTTNFVTISGNLIANAMIKIFNNLGQLMLIQKNQNTTFTIDVASFKTGIYFVEVNQNGHSQTLKFSKQ